MRKHKGKGKKGKRQTGERLTALQLHSSSGHSQPSSASLYSYSTETVLTRSLKITSFWLNSVDKTQFSFDFLVAFDVIKCSPLLEALSHGFCEILKPTSQTLGWVLVLCPLLPRGHPKGFYPNHSPLLILQAPPPHSPSY